MKILEGLFTIESFREFILSEASNQYGTSMSGNLRSNRDRSRSHFNSYVAPYLTPEQHKKSLDHMEEAGALLKGEREKMESEYEKTQKRSYDDEGEHHVVTSGKEAGDKVKIKHVEVEGDNLVAVTHDKRRIPLQRLSKPSALARKKQSMGSGNGRKIGAGESEVNINKNLGQERNPAVATGHDAVYPPEEQTAKIHVREVPRAQPKASAKMEIKGSTKVRMGDRQGDSGLKWNEKTKKWELGKNADEVTRKLVTAKHKETGLSVLDHLNKHHAKTGGVLDKGLSFDAKGTGMAKTYLEHKGCNTLHLHDNKEDKGTTYTYGNELKGKVGLGHLSDEDVSNMDGHVRIEKSASGKLKIYHVPHAKHLKALAHASGNEEGHLNLTDPEHAKTFMSNVDKLNEQKKRRSSRK